MDYIDIDQVYDVPDTPDRGASKGASCSGRVPIQIDSSVSGGSRNVPVSGKRPRNPPRDGAKLIIDDGLDKRLSFDPVKSPRISSKGDEDYKLSIAEPPCSKNAHLFRRTMTGEPPNPANRISLNSQRKDKGISVDTSRSSLSRENAVVDLTKQSPAQILEMAFPKEKRNSMVASDADKGKERIDDSFKGTIPPPRARGLKRLVKNGFISPHNIAKNKQVAENNSDGSIHLQNDVAPRVSDCSLDRMKELVSEDSNSCRVRRLKNNLSLPKDADKKNMPSRQCIAHSKDGSEPSTSVRDELKALDERGGWRNTCKLKMNSPGFAEEKNRNQKNGSAVRRFNSVGSDTSSGTLIKRHKNGPSSSNHGESSSLPFVDSDVVVSNLRSRRNLNDPGVGTSSSVIENDEFSPDMRYGDSANRVCTSSDDSYAKAMQLEADEMLALELQEQMYNEMSQVRNHEIDAHIALALQEEETSQQALAGANLPVLNPRGGGSSNSTRRSQSWLSRNPSARTTTQDRRSSSLRFSRLRRQVFGRSHRMPVGQRSSVFPSGMDLDTRMHILEALEAFNDMGVASSVFQADRDFNENDYEMLLGLDENNHQHTGTSVHAINNLPQSTVQNDNAEDCAVCLETPTIGDTIRHLPCMHKFHKDCIDPWLRRNTSCPVCKSSVT